MRCWYLNDCILNLLALLCGHLLDDSATEGTSKMNLKVAYRDPLPIEPPQ